VVSTTARWLPSRMSPSSAHRLRRDFATSSFTVHRRNLDKLFASPKSQCTAKVSSNHDHCLLWSRGICCRRVSKCSMDCTGVYGLRLRSSVFGRRACVYSKIGRDIPLVRPNAISKNSNNVVNSSPRVLIFSGIIVPINLIRHIRSRDHAHFWFGRQGASNFFFKLDSLGNRSSYLWNFFRLLCRPPKVKIYLFYCDTVSGC